MATKRKSPAEVAESRKISNQNLRPIKKGELTKEEAKRRGRNGGKKSVQVKKEQRTIRQMMEEVMSWRPEITPAVQAQLDRYGAPKGIDYTNAMLGVIAYSQSYVKGDHKAFQKCMEVMGQDPRVLIEQQRLSMEMESASHVPGFAALDAAVEAMGGDEK